jgi:acetyl esterase/lipase
MNDARSTSGNDALWASIEDLGRTLDKHVVEASFQLIEPLVSSLSAGGVSESEISYGPHPRHRIDLYQAARAGSAPKPLLLFVHGGGYSSGDKRMGPFFANLGRWAASAGLVGAAMNYRLAPEHKWPRVQEDIGAAIRWLRAHADQLGADPDRIVLMGHSAGAGHCAGYAANPNFHTGGSPGVAGLILVSGVYDLTLASDFGRSSRSLYYGSGDAVEAERSCVRSLAGLDIPVALLVAELDPPELHAQALAVLGAHMQARSALPAFTRLARHNHYTGILSAGLAIAAQLHCAILDFISTDCAAGATSARPDP